MAIVVAAMWIHALDRSNGTLISSGQKREYLLYVPKSYDPNKPTPLVISMHGAAAETGRAESCPVVVWALGDGAPT